MEFKSGCCLHVVDFKHIVNLERIRGYNSINFREGYQMTEIRTPNEIFRDENGN